MTALRGCPYCNGWMHYNQLACNECNGTNSRESYRKRIANLYVGLHAAAVEELRHRASAKRIAARLHDAAQAFGNGVGAAVLEAVAKAVEEP